MTRCSGDSIHGNRLVLSSPDDLALAKAVEEKFVFLCTVRRNMRGMDIVVPESLRNDMFLWRQMLARHKRGDFRHTGAEMMSLRTVAEWTLAEHAKLRNQPIPKMVWRD